MFQLGNNSSINVDHEKELRRLRRLRRRSDCQGMFPANEVHYFPLLAVLHAFLHICIYASKTHCGSIISVHSPVCLHVPYLQSLNWSESNLEDWLSMTWVLRSFSLFIKYCSLSLWSQVPLVLLLQLMFSISTLIYLLFCSQANFLLVQVLSAPICL